MKINKWTDSKWLYIFSLLGMLTFIYNFIFIGPAVIAIINTFV